MPFPGVIAPSSLERGMDNYCIFSSDSNFIELMDKYYGLIGNTFNYLYMLPEDSVETFLEKFNRMIQKDTISQTEGQLLVDILGYSENEANLILLSHEMMELRDSLLNTYSEIFSLPEDSLRQILGKNIGNLPFTIYDYLGYEDDGLSDDISFRSGNCDCGGIRPHRDFIRCVSMIEIEVGKCTDECLITLGFIVMTGSQFGFALGNLPGLALGFSGSAVIGAIYTGHCIDGCNRMYALECEECLQYC